MSREMQIEVITYEKDRLDYFTDLMKKAQKRYKRLFKKFKDAPPLSAWSQVLSDAGREVHFHGDVVEMLEKGYHKQSEGELVLFKPRRENRNATYKCSVCGKLCSSYYNDVGEWKHCPHCGARMKGGE